MTYWLPSRSPIVKRRSPPIDRLEYPVPRPDTFQAKAGPSASHCFSRLVSADLPSRLGPRNCGQLPVAAAPCWAASHGPARPKPAASTTAAATKRPRSSVMRMQIAPERNTHGGGRLFRRVAAGDYHRRPPDAQGAAAMPGSPSLLRRLRSRVWPMPVAGLLLATAVAAQSPAPPPAGLRLHGLVEAVEFFSVVAPSGQQRPAHDRPHRAEGDDRQERRPRRRVRSPGRRCARRSTSRPSGSSSRRTSARSRRKSSCRTPSTTRRSRPPRTTSRWRGSRPPRTTCCRASTPRRTR